MSICLGLAKHQNSRIQVKILSIAIKNNNNKIKRPSQDIYSLMRFSVMDFSLKCLLF